jgi:polyribonucleotide nucleotidyltransferase
MADGASGVRVGVTLAEAKAILATETVGTERYALANTVVSKASALEMVNAELEKLEVEVKESRAALRRAQDAFDDQCDVIEQLRKELGRCS